MKVQPRVFAAQVLEKAGTVLKEYSVQSDEAMLTLSVFTNEGITEITDILVRMQNADIEVTGFLQRKLS